MSNREDRLIEGAIDFHLHAFPYVDEDSYKFDIFEMARAAGAVGMRGLVLKSYCWPTCAMAYLATKYAGGCRVIGGVTLGRALGGFNPYAIRAAAKYGMYNGAPSGKLVWMPERDSRHHARFYQAPESKLPRYLSPFIGGDVSRGLLPEAIEVCRLVAQEDMVLAMSHLSPVEGLALLKEARELGVKRMVVTHASMGIVGYNFEQKQQAIKLGALIEECYINWLPIMQTLFNFHPVDYKREIVEHIRELGPENYILSTDAGVKEAPPPVECMREMIKLMVRDGFSDNEIRKMVSENPAKMLGMD